MRQTGTQRFNAKHMYFVKIKIGISQKQVISEVKEEPNGSMVFIEFIYESHFVEIKGHTALLLFIEGSCDDEIYNKFNEIIIPSLEKIWDWINNTNNNNTYGKTIRLVHNYLPIVNLNKGKIKK